MAKKEFGLEMNEVNTRLQKAALEKDQAGLFAAYVDLAGEYRKTGLAANAFQYLEKARETVNKGYDPGKEKLIGLLIQMGGLASQMGELEKARDFFRQGLDLNPDGPRKVQLQVGLAGTLSELGEPAEAIRICVTALSVPGGEMLLKMAAEALLWWVQSYQEMQSGSRPDRLTMELLLNLAQAGAAGVMPARIAGEMLSEAIRICLEMGDQPSLARCAETRAELVLHDGKVREAREELKQALEIYQFLKLRKESNRVYLRLKQLDDASSQG